MDPTKAVVFGPIIIFFAILGVLIFLFIGFVIKLLAKSKASSWEGELVDKFHKSKRDFESNKMEHFYTLVFKTKEGKEIKVGTSQSVWEDYKIGDKAIKKAGTFWPEKIS